MQDHPDLQERGAVNMVDYVESPLEQLIRIHLPKKPGDGGGGGGGGGGLHCVTNYVYDGLPLYIYYAGGLLYLQPHSCCPPKYDTANEDTSDGAYNQHTVWGEGSPQVTLTWTFLGDPDVLTGPGVRMGAWIRPWQNPLNFAYSDLWQTTSSAPGHFTLLGPAGDPTQILPSDHGALTIVVPDGLIPADIPGAPPPDPLQSDERGTTIQFGIQTLKAGVWTNFSWFGLSVVSTITVANNCPPGSLPQPPPPPPHLLSSHGRR
jgi:hypothetical protein